ncbi:ankyrin [Peniophora sp. CONT]|nr:ankyrin [Peniophora sp. CONT]
MSLPIAMEGSQSLPQDTLDFAHKMFDAARNGETELLRSAVEAGLPPNLTNPQGNTLLMLAAYANHVETVKMLLEHGADANRQNDKGQSPVAGAVFKGSDEVVHALMAGGADPRAGQPNAIQSARMFNRVSMLEVLGAKDGEGMDAPMPVGPPT